MDAPEQNVPKSNPYAAPETTGENPRPASSSKNDYYLIKLILAIALMYLIGVLVARSILADFVSSYITLPYSGLIATFLLVMLSGISCGRLGWGTSWLGALGYVSAIVSMGYGYRDGMPLLDCLVWIGVFWIATALGRDQGSASPSLLKL